MIVGIGIDAVELERIERALQHSERFAKRVLTSQEYDLYTTLSPKRQVEFVAGRFAAKEAYAKAIGTGVGEHFSFQDISILPNEKGAPTVFGANFEGTIHISITHTSRDAYAQIIIEKK